MIYKSIALFYHHLSHQLDLSIFSFILSSSKPLVLLLQLLLLLYRRIMPRPSLFILFIVLYIQQSKYFEAIKSSNAYSGSIENSGMRAAEFEYLDL